LGFVGACLCDVLFPEPTKVKLDLEDRDVLWRLVGITGEPVVCYIVDGGVEGLALIVERRDETIVAEMTPSREAALVRAEQLHATLVAQGMRET
jgi:hypothetical protein